jgi:hypothetical protein
MACTTWSRAAGATRTLLSARISARVFVDSGPGTMADSSSGSGGSTCSQLLSTSVSTSASASASASTSVSVEVSVTLTHVTPASEGVSVPALLLSLASPVFASSPAASEEASAATGAAFSSLSGSTTESSALAFSFSASASALLSSSSFSFSYITKDIGQRPIALHDIRTDAPPFLARALSLLVPS